MSMVSQIISFVLVLLVALLATNTIEKFIRIPISIIQVLLGIAIGLVVVDLGYDTGITYSNFHDIVFFIVLPLLVFEAAYNINVRELLRNLLPVIVLSTFGVLVTCALIAAGLFWGINHPGFPLIAALITGSILAATDPVSVISILKTVKAPERLVTLLEGESLFNDATSIVLFALLLTAALSCHDQDLSVANGIINFLKVFFGGIVVGIIIGIPAYLITEWSTNQVHASICTIVSALSSFLIAESHFHVSGIMACMVVALFIAQSKTEKGTPISWAKVEVPFLWKFISDTTNGIVFLLIGITVTFDMFTERWLAMLIGIAATLVARLISIGFSFGIINYLSKKIQPTRLVSYLQ